MSLPSQGHVLNRKLAYRKYISSPTKNDPRGPQLKSGIHLRNSQELLESSETDPDRGKSKNTVPENAHYCMV